MENPHETSSFLPSIDVSNTSPEAGDTAMVGRITMLALEGELAQLRRQNLALADRNQQLDADNQRLESDMARLATHAAKLHEESRQDPMTGLFNKKAFGEQVDTLIDQDKPFVVFMADLMSLKAINDTLGHAAGDAAITNTATVLKFGMTVLDAMTLIGLEGAPVTARLGGDEYAMVIPLNDLNQFTGNQMGVIDEALHELDEDPSGTSLYSREILERAKAGELTYEDAAQMIYIAVDRLYYDYLESNGGPDLGQGIAMGWAIHSPGNSEEVTSKKLIEDADAAMYFDKGLKKELLGSYNRETGQWDGPDRRNQQDDRRNDTDQREGTPDRRNYVTLGSSALRNVRPIAPPNPM